MTTVVMTHGAFCAGWTFDRFRRPFEDLGWTVLTPDLPGHEPGGAVAGRSMREYADSLVELCANLPERPILVGHSMGGLACQMAARRIDPVGMVLLAPSPPWGVTGSSIEEAVTALGASLVDPFWFGAVDPDLLVMRRHSLYRLSRREQDEICDRMGPESGRAVREVLTWWLDPFMTTSIGPGPLRTPTLVIAGGTDQVHPPRTVRQTAQRIGGAFRMMPGMSHWLIGEPGWERVAQNAIDWLQGADRAAA